MPRMYGGGAVIVALVAAGPVLAQERQQGSGSATSDAADIIVTGSRIARPETETPSPIVAYGEQDIQRSGFTNLTDFLKDTPSLSRSVTSNQDSFEGTGSNDGINTLNLRNLGDNRTLVLVDGRRHVGARQGSSAVDINTIPTDLIERIDIVSGGASAVYGADAVSGVVNFILRKDFEGVQARGQIGISSLGDAGTRFGSIIAGRNFADGRANVAIGYEHSEDDGLLGSARSYARGGGNLRPSQNQADIPDNPAIPDVAFVVRQLTNTSRAGAVDTGRIVNGVFVPGAFDGVPEFNGDGRPYNLGIRQRRVNGAFGPFSVGGDGAFQADNIFTQLRTAQTRDNVNLLSHLDVSPALKLSFSGKYARNRSDSIAGPYNDDYFVAADNPFIPASIRPAAGQGVRVGRASADLGNVDTRVKLETLRGSVDATGALADWLSYDASYVYGQTRERTDAFNRFNDRFFAALDVVTNPVTGQPACRSTLDPAALNPYGNYADAGRLTFTPGAAGGCVPLNLFGEGMSSQAARDFVLTRAITRSKVTQQVANLSFTGTFDRLFRPAAGSIGFALGAEWRRETSMFNPDRNLIDGVLFDSTQRQRGAYEVKELLGELNVPILADRPLVHQLTIVVAGRYSEYTSAGSNTTWNVEGIYAPVRGLRLRGTISKAVRAPNIGELFAGASVQVQAVGDACSLANQDDGSSFRPANCRALLGALGVDPATYDSGTTGEARVVVSGNPDLDVERAKTWTAGIAIDPGLVPRLNLSIDWYNIRITNAINFFVIEDAQRLCVDQPSLDNPFCPLVTRARGTGFITSGRSTAVNVAAIRTSGADLTINYAIPTARVGAFNLHFVGGYLDRLTYTDTPGADPRRLAGIYFSPKYTATGDVTWRYDALTLNYGLSWFSKTNVDTPERLRAEPDLYPPGFLKERARWVHDVQASLDVAARFTLYGGVNNLFDQQPGPTLLNYPVEPFGRYFYMGAKVRI